MIMEWYWQALLLLGVVAVLGGGFWWGSRQDWSQARAHVAEKADAQVAVQSGTAAAAGPGWYADPWGHPGLTRYWDGEVWGEVAPAAPGVVARASQPDTALFVIAWIVAVCTFGYFIPWAVAATRGMPNTGGVFVVNLLTGWTLIGWIIALVMACQQRSTL